MEVSAGFSGGRASARFSGGSGGAEKPPGGMRSARKRPSPACANVTP
ncbi:MAG: hypothetical protein MZV70_07610 [Desulfobacterales bacterium]|nr:hypothetical protein [Desulfobacterales bacterium]